MHVVIAEQLREWIEAGQYAPGERLPSEFDLGEKFGVSRTTVRRAISNLIQQGLVTTQQGKGIFVKDRQKISFSLSSPLMYFDAELRRQGHKGSVQTLRFQPVTPTTEVRKKLNLSADAVVYWQQKIIFADEMPIALDVTYYPEAVGQALEDQLKQGFTYSTLAANGYRLTSSEVCLESIPATYKLSEYLDVPLGTPLHLYRYVSAGRDSQPIVCGETISRCDRTCYLAHIVSEPGY
ncbi:GntR family transcriptional regulator [filamentous cyanobacterium CCP5]|nr:GntR family transcriptional regulator [filamentous cyanobacterium CCP5]